MRIRALASLALATWSAAGVVGCGGDDATAPTIVSFTASRAQVGVGDRVDLTWKVEGATTLGVSATPGGVVVDGSTALENTVPSGPITATTKFVLTARDAEGGTASAEVTVSVDGAQLRITRFVADPAQIDAGATATLRWTIAGSPIGQVRVLDPAGTELTTGVEASGSLVVTPTADTVYRLEVSNTGQTVSATTAVAVRITPPVITRFEAMPNPAATGTRGQVSWNTERADEVQIKRDGMVVRPWNSAGAAAGFTAFVFQAQSSVFTLEARNGAGMVSQDLTITTLDPPTAALTVTPDRFTTATTTAAAEWMVTNADTFTLTVGGRVPAGFTGQAAGSLTITATRTVEVVLSAQNAVDSLTVRRSIRRVAVFTQDVVTGPNATPLDAAAVRIEDASGTRSYEGLTDATGRATVEIEAEMLPVSVSVAKNNHFATAVVGLTAPMTEPIRIDPVPQAPNPPPPDPVIGDLAGTFFNKGSINDRVLVTGVDVEGSDGSGISYMMRYIVDATPLTLVALDFGPNDRLINAVVTSTVRTAGPMSVAITFPRPAVEPQATVVGLRMPTTGAFAGQNYQMAGQAVVQQTPDKNDVVVGDSTLGSLTGGVLPWTITSFAGPGLEVDAAGVAINGSTLRMIVVQRVVGAPVTVDIAPLPRFEASATAGSLGDLRVDYDGPAYDGAVLFIGNADFPNAYRVVLPPDRVHTAVRVPRLPNLVGFRGLGVGLAGNADVTMAVYQFGGEAPYLLPFSTSTFGFPDQLHYMVERQPGSFTLQGF